MFPDKIELIKGQDTPGVIFDLVENKFLITGRSFPADADKFYQQLIKWLDEFKNSKPEKPIVFEVKMEYFNTASAKMLLDTFFKLEDIKESGFPVSIKWYSSEDDEDMTEAGEEFEDILELDFDFIEYEEED
ncbi:MAG: DUF1987 domain-containing protein [Bacteroidales bacterium]|nr:DUF1987 domain-containing protein [Bacteroidales bacterium]